MTKEKRKLFLIPLPIHEDGLPTIPQETIDVIYSLDHFIVERARTARRFVSSLKHPRKIDDLIFEEIPEEKMTDREIETLLSQFSSNGDIGLMSEAGMPAIADPGNHYVRVAQKMGVEIIPLSGPSSIMMALMASGLEGQRFSFHGYLSAKKTELPAQLRHLDQRADIDDATQIWIEAPYRNKQILDAVERNIAPQRMFCIAAGIGQADGFVITKSVSDWKKKGWPEIHKVPSVFLIR